MPSTLFIDKLAKGYRSTGKMSPVGRGKRASEIRKNILKKAAKQTELKKREKEREATKKKMGGRGPISPKKAREIKNVIKTEKLKKKTRQKVMKKHQIEKAKKANLILADVDTEETEETEAGTMSDDAIERAKENERKKKKMLEEAGKA